MKNFWQFIKFGVVAVVCVPLLVAGVEAAEIETVPDLILSAVNAGYTGPDGSQQNYDFVEIFNTTGEPVRLEKYSLVYTNSAGNRTVHNFLAGAILNAEFLAMGYSNAPQFAEAENDYKYRFNLAAATGTVSLLLDDVVVDEVCWGSATCAARYAAFATSVASNSTLVRCIVDGLVEPCADDRPFEFRSYYPEFDFGVLLYDVPEEEPPEEPPEDLPSCRGLIFSEIFTYFEFDYAEQFVELFNPTDEIIPLDSCKIDYKNRNYEMAGEIRPGEYLAYRHANLQLSKNPTSSNIVALIDGDGAEVVSLVYYSGQKKLVSWAFFGVDEDGNGVWRQTYALTPSEENIYQEFRSCPAGKIINPRTGNCINFFEDEPLPDCPAGKFRNPETNRCKSYETVAKILEPCAEGYYRNPETNRCRKIETATASLTPCQEGYERNPETNRCRKIRENNGADYGVEPTDYTDTSAFVAYGALAVVGTSGVTYAIFQFRHELAQFLRKTFGKHGRMKL